MHNNKLDLIEFHIVEHCNLNCKSCMHFSPLADKSFIKISDFKRDVKKMAEITKGNVETINILGGEPLLHPSVLKLLKTARYYFKNSEIRLVSNGILVPTQKELFWKTLKSLNIHLSITKYPLDINYQKISYLTQKYGIKYTFYAPSKENSQWYFPLDVDGKQDPAKSFENCRKGNNCTNINIFRGKLYMCPVVSYVRYFNKFFNKNLPVEESDYLSLKNIKDIQEILDFISKPTPFCRFCNISARTYDNKWERSKLDIAEWT